MNNKSNYYERNKSECGFHKVEGWVVEAIFPVLEFCKEMLQGNGSTLLASMEIGVHHGRFFLLLEQITPPSEPCVAIDVFGMQQFNVDKSGSGSMTAFNSNVDAYAVNPGRVKVIEMDSSDLCREVSFKLLPVNSYSLISVDGCHTAKHTYLDLETSARVIAPGGICILDDIGNLSWLDVLTGAVDYLRDPSSTLAPFACGFNKLLLTTIAYQRIYFEYFRTRHSEIKSLPAFQWPRITSFCGYNVFRYGI